MPRFTLSNPKGSLHECLTLLVLERGAWAACDPHAGGILPQSQTGTNRQSSAFTAPAGTCSVPPALRQAPLGSSGQCGCSDLRRAQIHPQCHLKRKLH